MMQMPQYPMQFFVPEPRGREVKCEEILNLLTLVLLSIYLVAHMLFLPLEFLTIAVLLDPEFKYQLYMICVLFGIKYLALGITLYCSYNHMHLHEMHSHIVLYIFSGIVILITGFISWILIVSEEEFRKIGIGDITQHPFFVDFIGFALCGILGSIHICYMACTHPKKLYTPLPHRDYVSLPTFCPPLEYAPQSEPSSFPFLPVSSPEFLQPPVQQKNNAEHLPIYFVPTQ